MNYDETPKTEDWHKGFIAGYTAGYTAGVEWARAAFVKIMKEHYERVAGRVQPEPRRTG